MYVFVHEWLNEWHAPKSALGVNYKQSAERDAIGKQYSIVGSDLLAEVG